MQMNALSILSNFVGLLLFAFCYWITILNEPKYAQILIGIGILSFVFGNLKSLQFGVILGSAAIVSIVVITVVNRAKSLEDWFERNGFRPMDLHHPEQFFVQKKLENPAAYNCYKLQIAEVPVSYIVKRQVHQVYRGLDYDHLSQQHATTEILVHGAYVFDNMLDMALIEQKLRLHKEITPAKEGWSRKFQVFDVGACEICKLETGVLIVCWRMANTVSAHESCLKWVQDALVSTKNKIR